MKTTRIMLAVAVLFAGTATMSFAGSGSCCSTKGAKASKESCSTKDKASKESCSTKDAKAVKSDAKAETKVAKEVKAEAAK